MEKLKKLVADNGVNIKPASSEELNSLKKILKIDLSKSYEHYLLEFGTIDYQSLETYGLGIPEGCHLDVRKVYQELCRDPSYPRSALPISEIGDGHYYLYDVLRDVIFVWASPNGGIVETISINLEDFLVQQIEAA